MPWARASSLHRFLACPAASWLPRFDDGTGSTKRGYLQGVCPEHGPSCIRGTVLNGELLQIRDKRAANAGREAHAAKERGELHPELWTGLDPKGLHELSFSYCCKTGMVRAYLHPNEHARDLWKALQCEHAVVGTADWVGAIGGRLWVDDLKTGWRAQEVWTPQLLFYAMCWADWHGQNRSAEWECKGVALSVTHQPRAKGVPTREGLWRRASPLDLETFRADLTAAWRVTTLDRRPRAGEHCAYCPSAAWCTAAMAA